MYITTIKKNIDAIRDLPLDTFLPKETEMPRKPIPPEMLIHGRPPLPRRNAKGERMLTVATCMNPRPRSYKDTSLPMIRMRGRSSNSASAPANASR